LIDYDVAINDVTTYRGQMVSICDASREGENVPPDEITKLGIDYERLVRLYVDAVGMYEPCGKEWHGHIVKYDNPAEWTVKEGSFFSLNSDIKF